MSNFYCDGYYHKYDCEKYAESPAITEHRIKLARLNRNIKKKNGQTQNTYCDKCQKNMDIHELTIQKYMAQIQKDLSHFKSPIWKPPRMMYQCRHIVQRCMRVSSLLCDAVNSLEYTKNQLWSLLCKITTLPKVIINIIINYSLCCEKPYVKAVHKVKKLNEQLYNYMIRVVSETLDKYDNEDKMNELKAELLEAQVNITKKHNNAHKKTKLITIDDLEHIAKLPKLKIKLEENQKDY